MLENFVDFGNISLDVTRIVGVSFKFKDEYREEGVSGLMKKVQSDKLEEVAIFLDNGSVIQTNGKEADAVLVWWRSVRTTVGDVL